MPMSTKYSRFSIASESVTQEFCPLLGCVGDQTTARAYATNINRCHAFDLAQIVDIDKQTEVCLTDCYETCELFKLAGQEPALKEPAAAEGRPPYSRTFRLQAAAPLLMILLILLAAVIWWPGPGSSLVDATAFGALEPAVGVDWGADAAVYDPPPAVQEEAAAPAATVPAFGEPERDEVQEAIKHAAALKQAAADTGGEEAAVVSAANQPFAPAALPDLHVYFQIETTQTAEEGQADSFSPLTYDAADVQISPLIAQATGSSSLVIFQDPDQESEGVQMSRLEPVSIVGRDASGEWFKVRTQSGISGWVTGTNTTLPGWAGTLPVVESADSAADSAPSLTTILPAVDSATVAVEELILRSAPGENFKPVAAAGAGDRVLLLGRWQEGPWVRIRLLDLTEGWVEADALLE